MKIDAKEETAYNALIADWTDLTRVCLRSADEPQRAGDICGLAEGNMKIDDPSYVLGQFFGGVELEICKDPGVSRPRVKAVTVFPSSMRVEFPRKLREMFPLRTRFKATVKVCQKTVEGDANGPPYLKAYDIAVIAASVPDEGLMAKVRKGSISGLSYEYHWVTKR